MWHSSRPAPGERRVRQIIKRISQTLSVCLLALQAGVKPCCIMRPHLGLFVSQKQNRHKHQINIEEILEIWQALKWTLPTSRFSFLPLEGTRFAPLSSGQASESLLTSGPGV